MEFPNCRLREPYVVIASTGRAGSTLLYKAILQGFCYQRCGYLGAVRCFNQNILERQFGGFVARLAEDKDFPPIAKTHDLFPEGRTTETRYIFVHSDPLDSALSVERKVSQSGLGWFARHQHNLRVPEEERGYHDLFTKDVLNYKRQLLSWMKQPCPPVLAIAYEDLWDQISAIEKFTGIRIRLPKRRKRGEKNKPSNISNSLFSELRELRESLSGSSVSFD